MFWNPGASGMLIGALQIATAVLLVLARVHIIPAGTGWPRVRERDGFRWPLLGLIVLTALLGVMRATGFDFWLIGEGRMIARGGDWYQERSVLQYVLLGVLALLYIAALLSIRHIRLRGPDARLGIGMAALIALIHIEVLRVVSLHAIDAVMYKRAGPITLAALAELSMLAVCIACFVPMAQRRFSGDG